MNPIINEYPYVVIADNEIRGHIKEHSLAQDVARYWSVGKHDTAKVVYLPNNTVQGIWHKGNRIQ